MLDFQRCNHHDQQFDQGHDRTRRYLPTSNYSCSLPHYRRWIDTNDEVRDRATFYLALLQNGQPSILSNYILNALQVSEVGLERILDQYVKSESYDKAFDLKQAPVSVEPITVTEKKPSVLAVEPIARKEEKNRTSRQDIYAKQLFAIVDFAYLDSLFWSSPVIELTEAVTEYNVSCVKHTVQEHSVLQFDCRNTLNDQLLEKAFVELAPAGYDEG